MAITNGGKVAVVMKGRSTNFAPMKVVQGSARFVVKGGVIGKFKSATGKTYIKIRNVVIPSDNGDPAVFGHLIGGEDSTDDDWQDILANVTCLHHAG